MLKKSQKNEHITLLRLQIVRKFVFTFYAEESSASDSFVSLWVYRKENSQPHSQKKAWFINVFQAFFLFCEFVSVILIKLLKKYIVYIGSFSKKFTHKLTLLFLHVKKPDKSMFFAFVSLWVCVNSQNINHFNTLP